MQGRQKVWKSEVASSNAAGRWYRCRFLIWQNLPMPFGLIVKVYLLFSWGFSSVILFNDIQIIDSEDDIDIVLAVV